MVRDEYEEKFSEMSAYNLYRRLDSDRQRQLREIAFDARLTVQEFYEVVKTTRDLDMWGKEPLPKRWRRWSERADNKSQIIRRMRNTMRKLRQLPADYGDSPEAPDEPAKQGVTKVNSDKEIFGDCPVASEETVCCNLKTIDVVENCPLGCSYCSIQTFYHDQFVFDENFSEKLANLKLDPDRHYYVCTGQSSDSLVWGNREGILDELRDFARRHENVSLELKTKTANVDYLLNHDIPGNVFCTWSLNPERVIKNEEHFTASLDERVRSACAVADRGIPVGFHIHPIIYYEGWDEEYRGLARVIQERFDSNEVVYVSLGSLTLIKPAIKKIREQGFPTKILQWPRDRDPHGKVTYPDDLKVRMYQILHDAFSAWHDDVFFYLCMEKSAIWDRVFGFHYSTNDEFEIAMLEHLPVGETFET